MAKERPPLEEMTLRQLRRVAQEYAISRYSRMRKSQLLAAIREAAQLSPVTPTRPSRTLEVQEVVEATKFELVGEDREGGTLAEVDEGLGDLPGGYGESCIVLMPRDPQWAYAYWDVPGERKEELRRLGGQLLALRLYDATGINLDFQLPHSIQEYPCDELAREWYLPIPVSDRDYALEIGYRCVDGRWLSLARSAVVRVPPMYPSDWIEDQFITVSWDLDLRGKTLYNLTPNRQRLGSVATTEGAIASAIYDLAQSSKPARTAGSLYGSMQQAPSSALSSYVLPASVGSWSVPTISGVGMSGAALSGVAGLTESGVGMSGAALYGVTGMSGAGLTMSGAGLSGVGFSASAPPIRPRKFWLIADAELIVYGATEPDAKVYISGQPIQLATDGTFRFQMSFQDGLIDYPVMAVATDGEQTRSIHLKFNRETPSRQTNTKAEAVEEWLA